MDEHARTEQTTCLVVGGGPAGMVLGLLLARAHINVTVLEKHGDFLRDFRGDTVHPSTLTLLDELGLGRQFAELPQSHVNKVAFPVNDEEQLTFADFTRLKVAHPYVALVPQWDFLDLLASAAAEEKTFSLRMETEATELLNENGRICGVRYRTQNGKTGEIRADLTIGCDGRWSIIREEARLRPREFPVPMDVWWFRLPRRKHETSPALAPTMRRGHFAVVIPREGYYQIAYLAAKGLDHTIRAEGITAFRHRVAECIPDLADRVDSLTSMNEVKHLDVRLNRLSTWHRPGVLCIGDAAHAMSPMGGVGINLAIQDAVATARLLAGPLQIIADRREKLAAVKSTVDKAAYEKIIDNQLSKVRAARLAHTLAVQGVQRLLHRAVVKPVINGRRTGPPAIVVAIMRRFPRLTALPAYLLGLGIRREHAPVFARRSTKPHDKTL